MPLRALIEYNIGHVVDAGKSEMRVLGEAGILIASIHTPE